MAYTQAGRPLRVKTKLEDDVLLLEGYEGSEAISRPFHFTLDLLSEDPAVDGRDLLGSAMSVMTRLPADEERFLHGRVSRFGLVRRMGDLTAYRAEIVPWFWFLSLSQDSRIFQEKTIPEIVEQVFTDLGWSDFDIRCTRSYPPREYCVQYRETHMDFVSRLLEEEGICYFFEHTEDKHTLVLADDSSAFEAVPGEEFRFVPRGGTPEEGEDFVREFVEELSVRSSRVALRNYDYLQPSFSLKTEIDGTTSHAGNLEVYDYPGGFAHTFDSVDVGGGAKRPTSAQDELDRYGRLQLEEEEALAHVVQGSGTVRAFRSGATFELRDHPSDPANDEYLLTRVHHSANTGDFRSARGSAFDYSNSFEGIPSSVPFRPSRTTPQPRIHGTQTAVVVGPAGEEIFVDKHGRIKVQFHWDRLGEYDASSSCWIRVATFWAGKSWGGVHLPRIGQEVVVAFVEGDPDRPMIVGSVYNAEQTPPYTLPDNHTQSGVKSRSSMKGGGSNFNEIRFEDKKGEEHLYIHAEKNQQIVVENDRTDSVGRDETRKIGRDHTGEVGRHRTVEVGENDKLDVGVNQTVSIGSDQTIDVGANHKESVGADRDESVGANEKRDVGGNQDEAIGGDRSVSVGANDSITAGADMAHGADMNLALSSGLATEATAGTSVKISAGTTVELSAGITIKLSAGGSSIEIGPAGVKITTGALVTVQGSVIKLN
ncbi:MAG: type VI secretion system tip protein TssI/VgrG [Gemmatimonadota bacterium]|jgi:type VI secretion system secreted protein VgrG